MVKYLSLLCVFLLCSCHKNEHVEYYPNGNIKLRAFKDNNVFDGMVKGYYENGDLKYTEEWDHGNINGEVKHYYPSGKLKEVTVWKNNKREGASKTYYQDGSIWSNTRYVQNKKMEVKFFYRNGKLLERQLYNNEGEVVYFEKSDSTEMKTFRTIVPLFSPKSDTFNLNETCKMIIYFGLPLRGEIKAFAIEPNNEKNQISDTVELKEIEPYVFQYNFKPQKLGSNSIPFFFEHETEDFDTLKLKGLNIKHSIYIKEKNTN